MPTPRRSPSSSRKKAISIISAEGKPFHSPAADEALFAAIKNNLHPEIGIIELDCEINDPEFARVCAHALLRNITASAP